MALISMPVPLRTVKLDHCNLTKGKEKLLLQYFMRNNYIFKADILISPAILPRGEDVICSKPTLWSHQKLISGALFSRLMEKSFILWDKEWKCVRRLSEGTDLTTKGERASARIFLSEWMCSCCLLSTTCFFLMTLRAKVTSLPCTFTYRWKHRVGCHNSDLFHSFEQ